MALRMVVCGVPAPQGSKRFVGLSKKGRGILIESSKKVKPWRAAVEEVARQAVYGLDAPICLGAVSLRLRFYFQRPKSVSASKRPWCIVYPDLSKLIRSTEDALTRARVWKDDAQVVWVFARKYYIDAGSAMQSEGCIIEVTCV